jgi:hypothetical protein
LLIKNLKNEAKTENLRLKIDRNFFLICFKINMSY